MLYISPKTDGQHLEAQTQPHFPYHPVSPRGISGTLSRVSLSRASQRMIDFLARCWTPTERRRPVAPRRRSLRRMLHLCNNISLWTIII